MVLNVFAVIVAAILFTVRAIEPTMVPHEIVRPIDVKPFQTGSPSVRTWRSELNLKTGKADRMLHFDQNILYLPMDPTTQRVNYSAFTGNITQTMTGFGAVITVSSAQLLIKLKNIDSELYDSLFKSFASVCDVVHIELKIVNDLEVIDEFCQDIVAVLKDLLFHKRNRKLEITAFVPCISNQLFTQLLSDTDNCELLLNYIKEAVAVYSSAGINVTSIIVQSNVHMLCPIEFSRLQEVVNVTVNYDSCELANCFDLTDKCVSCTTSLNQCNATSESSFASQFICEMHNMLNYVVNGCNAVNWLLAADENYSESHPVKPLITIPSWLTSIQDIQYSPIYYALRHIKVGISPHSRVNIAVQGNESHPNLRVEVFLSQGGYFVSVIAVNSDLTQEIELQMEGDHYSFSIKDSVLPMTAVTYNMFVALECFGGTCY